MSKYVGTGPSSYEKRIYWACGLTKVEKQWSRPTRRSLPPLYAPALLNKGHSLCQLSESEPESACTIRVPYGSILDQEA